MSGATHTRIPIRQQLLHDRRRAKTIALVAVASFTALIVTLILVLAAGDSPSGPSEAPAAGVTQQSPTPAIAPAKLGPETRYDGGPEEGSRGAFAPAGPKVDDLPSSPPASADQRYDGGPEEGIRGAGR